MKAKKHLNLRIPLWWPSSPGWQRLARAMTPHPGTLVVTLVVLAAILWAQSVGALPLRAPLAASTSTGAIAYQGRLADADGTPITDTVNMEFRLYDVASGGIFLWEELWTGSNSVQVSDGLFNVMLGSMDPIPQSVITDHDSLFLGITVGTDDEMTPRVQLGSVPFAVQALTVPDGSVTTAKIADGTVTTGKISDGAVTTTKLNIDNGLNVSGDLAVDGRIAVGTTISDTLTIGRHDSPMYTTRIDGNRITIDDGPYAPAHVNSYWNHLFLYTDVGSVYIRNHNGETEDLIVSGNLTVSGTKSAIVNTAQYGQRKLYAAESPEVRFTDEGLAQLVDGAACVDLDPIFLETIEGEYLVHVTPYGDASLYVVELGADYFVVKARDGAPNVAFAWRLSAHRKGYSGVRLEQVQED